MKPTILIVEDEPDLVNLLRYNLQKEGYDVVYALNGKIALELAWDKRPDLIILDLMLPDRSGIDVCREIKSHEALARTPIIMLTARSSEIDRISGFEAGAEDYVVKPFSPKELLWRVRAMLGRTRPTTPETLLFGPMAIYPGEYRVTVDGVEAPLTSLEFQILLVLAQYPNVVKTREQILQSVWQEEAVEVLDRTVDAHVKRLRSKLGAARDAVETVRGVGYRLTTTSSAASPHAAP
ncbi:MAG: response regulator transcription factor [Vampirovibrionales bacterium]|nr:response regulator transcription factor [Vampirovibrionales bacterium]